MLAGFTKRAAAALVALAASAVGASAQNFDGTGVIKFGAYGHGSFLNFDVAKPVAGSASPSGGGAGLSVSYDLFKKGAWLIGVELDGMFGDARGKLAGTSYGYDYMTSLRARVGFYPRYDWLVYGTAGGGYLGYEVQQPGVGNKNSETVLGFVGGAGTEIDLHHVILFGEYLYGNFEDRSFTINNVRHNVDPEAHIFKVGVKFKVGHDYDHEIDREYRRYEPLK